MRVFKTTSTWVVVLALAVGFGVSTAGAAAAKKKPRAKRPANLLEIPKVSKDRVICFALYTVHDNVLKLTAQLYPLEKDDPRTVRLEVKRDGKGFRPEPPSRLPIYPTF